MSDQPEITFRQGPCSASVYKQEYERGGEKFYLKIVRFHRRYQDKNGDWQIRTMLPVNDIPKAVIVLQKAYEYITSNLPYPHDESEEVINVTVLGRMQPVTLKKVDMEEVIDAAVIRHKG